MVPLQPEGALVRVAGAVICRQRPGTAHGFLFLTLEDETGLVNVIVRPDVFREQKDVLVATRVLEVEGVLQSVDEPAAAGLRTGARPVHVRALHVRPALAAPVPRSRWG